LTGALAAAQVRHVPISIRIAYSERCLGAYPTTIAFLGADHVHAERVGDATGQPDVLRNAIGTGVDAHSKSG